MFLTCLFLIFSYFARHLMAQNNNEINMNLLDESNSNEVFCTNGDYRIVGSFFTQNIFTIVAYDRVNREHVMYYIHEDVLANHMQFSSLYLKNTFRTSMTEMFNYDPAKNDSLTIKSIRMVTVPGNTIEYSDGFRKILVITYRNLVSFIHTFKYFKEPDIVPVMEVIMLTGDLKRLKQSFIFDSEDNGYQFVFDYSTAQWFVNDAEQYEAKIWSHGPVHRIGFVGTKKNRYLMLLPSQYLPPKDFEPLTYRNLSGFIENKSKKVVLFADNVVLILTDTGIGVRHSFPFLISFEKYSLRQFFTCSREANHPLFGSISFIGLDRQRIVIILFYGVVVMAAIILFYSLYKACIWNRLIKKIDREHKLKIYGQTNTPTELASSSSIAKIVIKE